ncbi:MAG: glycosyltransferase [Candidatus Wallbacteria bacterium]|nr:glycosyltransferase [Candidatus Wallbacteria bacterium]
MNRAKLNVLELVKLFYPPEVGGIEVFVNEFSHEAAKFTNLKVLCASNDSRKHLDQFEGFKAYRAPSLGKFFSLPVAPGALWYLKQALSGIDLIHFHLPNPIFNLAWCLLNPDLPIVIQWHSDIVRQWYFMPFYQPFQTMLLKRANCIVTTTPNYIDGSQYLAPFKDKCRTIPLGINPGKFTENPAMELEIRRKYPGKPIVFSLGRLIPYKGYSYLVEAAREFDAYVLIGGEGPLRNELQQQIRELNLSDRVFLLGGMLQKELAAYYRACDLFALSSITRNEAFGIVQMEAMYFGRPVVSTVIPGSGVSWVNQDGITGFTVPCMDAKAFGGAVKKILSNPELASEFSTNAKQRFEELFHIRSVVQAYLQIFEEVAGNR